MDKLYKSQIISNEKTIIPIQIGSDKVNKHQAFLKQLIIEESIPYNFETIWKIR